MLSTATLPDDQSDPADVPLAVRQLVAGLRGSKAPLVRTAVLVLPPADYLTGAEAWASALDLTPIHLGLHVAERAESRGNVRVFLDANSLLGHALDVLPVPDPTYPNPAEPGAWVWGFDALLALLSETERAAFWLSLRQTPSKRPPLVLVLPAVWLARFGPADPNAWGPRFTQLP